MFLRVARSVVRQTEKKLEEAIGHEETQKAVHQQLAGMKKMLLTLESFQDLLVTQGGRERGLDLSQGIDSIVGRLVLLQYLKHAEQKVKRQRKELKRLNRENEYLRHRLRYDLCTMRKAEDRWTILNETSPSGKTLFCCKVCGRVSATPDKGCRTIADPQESLGCSKWPSHPKQLSNGARMVYATAALEEVLGEGADTQQKIEYAHKMLTDQRTQPLWGAAGRGSRELAAIIEEELVACSSDPHREQRIEKLIELCGEVKRGRLAGQAWGGE